MTMAEGLTAGAPGGAGFGMPHGAPALAPPPMGLPGGGLTPPLGVGSPPIEPGFPAMGFDAPVGAVTSLPGHPLGVAALPPTNGPRPDGFGIGDFTSDLLTNDLLASLLPRPEPGMAGEMTHPSANPGMPSTNFADQLLAGVLSLGPVIPDVPNGGAGGFPAPPFDASAPDAHTGFGALNAAGPDSSLLQKSLAATSGTPGPTSLPGAVATPGEAPIAGAPTSPNSHGPAMSAMGMPADPTGFAAIQPTLAPSGVPTTLSEPGMPPAPIPANDGHGATSPADFGLNGFMPDALAGVSGIPGIPSIPGLSGLTADPGLPDFGSLMAMLGGGAPDMGLLDRGMTMLAPAQAVPAMPHGRSIEPRHDPRPGDTLGWPSDVRGTTPEGNALGVASSGSGGFSAVELAAIRADFPILNQDVNGYPLAWLDNAATTQKPRHVIEALNTFYRRDNSNVHRAAHTLAARATEAYEHARDTVQRFLKAKTSREIIFVRGTTEAINLVAKTYGKSVLGPGDEVLVTTLEHHANIVPWQMVCRETGAILRPIPITDTGEIDMSAYANMLNAKVKIVSLSHVSNVLGTVVPVREMTAMAHMVGAKVLVDGAQSVAHMPVDVCSIGCDFYVFSGHKLFGPTGVGALWGRLALLEEMPPWQGGGNMIDRVTFQDTTYQPVPAKFEAGTAILAGAVGLGAAIDYVQSLGLERIGRHEHGLVEAAMAGLAAVPGLRLYGTAPNKASVTAFLIANRDPVALGKHLNSRGIAVRVGHHCAQPTMDRYGVTQMVRPSFAFYNTHDEVDRLLVAVREFLGTH